MLLQGAFALCLYGIASAAVAMELVCRLPEEVLGATLGAALRALQSSEVGV